MSENFFIKTKLLLRSVNELAWSNEASELPLKIMYLVNKVKMVTFFVNVRELVTMPE